MKKLDSRVSSSWSTVMKTRRRAQMKRERLRASLRMFSHSPEVMGKFFLLPPIWMVL